MNKRFFYLAASALVLSACTSESVTEDAVKNGSAIAFDNVVKKHSRADVTDLSGNSLKQFNVFGYYTTPHNEYKAIEVFNDVPVTRNADGKWSYTGEQRSWVPGGKYFFYAYSCGQISKLNTNYGDFTMDMTNDLENSDRVLKINGYVCDATHQHDLIYASNTGATESDPFAGIIGKDKANKPVQFQFSHLLSKVKAQFSSEFPEGYEIYISDVTIQNIRNVGSYNPNASSGWQNVVRDPEDSFPFVYLLNTDDPETTPIHTTVGGDAVSTNSAFVLPYTYNDNDVYIKFDLTVMNKGEEILNKELTGKFNPIWVAGYSYVYNIKINGSAAGLEVITFTTTTDESGNVVSEWVSDSTSPNITLDK